MNAQLAEILRCLPQPVLVLDCDHPALFTPPAELGAALSVVHGLGYRTRAQHSHHIALQSPNHSLELCLHWSLGWDIPWQPVLAAARPDDSGVLAPHSDDLLPIRLLALRQRGWRAPLQHFQELAAAINPASAARAEEWGLRPLLGLLGDALDQLGLSHPLVAELPEDIRLEGRARISGLAPSRHARFDRWLVHGRSWPWRYWATILEAWAGFWLVEGALASLGYTRLKRWLDLEGERLPLDGKRAQVMEAVLTAGRLHPCRPQCLARAVVLCLMLRGRGLGGRVRLGARLRGQRFQAHAWLEVAGQRLDVGESFWDFQPFAPLR